MMDKLQKEEDNNLIKINLLQNEEQNFRKANDKAEENIQKQLNEINKFECNIPKTPKPQNFANISQISTPVRKV